MKRIFFFISFTLALTGAAAKEKSPTITDRLAEYVHSVADKAPSGPAIETAFSPEAGSQALIVKVINSSEKSIRLAAYSFTSPVVVRALMNAKRRGVDVQVVVDQKGNKSKASIAALNLIVNAGIPAKTISRYAIHHDKFIVSDGRHVQTGSFNYSKSAAERNSENVIVIWNSPAVSASYLRHWQSRFSQGTEFRSTY